VRSSVSAPLAGRLAQPRIALAIALLGITGGLIAAFLYARGELVGADARAYWAAVRIWLAGGDPYQQVGAYLPYAYAPWTLLAFVPWALLPWGVAWTLWQTMSMVLFGLSVAWAYARRPLATAVLVALLGVPLAANLDTGNVALPLVLGIWLAWFAGPRLGGAAWAFAAAMKWLPVLLLPFIPPRARLWGVAFAGVAALLTLATWPQTLRQLEVVLNFPRPLRIDYLLLAWAAVPWLWSQPWPPWWLTAAGWRARWTERRSLAGEVRAFFALSPVTAGSSGTSTADDPPPPRRS
jgi:hypothetical protein